MNQVPKMMSAARSTMILSEFLGTGKWLGSDRRVEIVGYSQSIVLSHGNALISHRNFFLHAANNRLPNPPKLRPLDFKGEFRRCAFFARLR
jgi:hypothetical protein